MSVCYKCGGQSPGLGLCDSCAKERVEREISATVRAAPQQRSARSRLLDSQTSYFAALGLVVLLLALLTTYGKPFFQEGPGYFTATGGYFVVANQDKTTQIRYALGGSAVVSGYALNVEAHDGAVKEGGVTLVLHYLEPEAYQKFVAEYGSSNQCPASFYNQYMHHTMVIPRQRSCVEALKKRSFDLWQKFTIAGTWIQFHDGVSNGEKVAMPNGNYNTLLTDQCQ